MANAEGGREEGERHRERASEREINYLSLNAKQRRQMSRGEDELQIARLFFSSLCRHYVNDMRAEGGRERRREGGKTEPLQ